MPRSALAPAPFSITPFEPDERTAEDIFLRLTDPDESFQDIADRAKTSIETLVAWMTRPDVARRIDVFEAAIARRARLAAFGSVRTAITALRLMLDGFVYDEGHILVNPRDSRAQAQRNRARDIARETASQLIRFAAHPPTPPTPSAAASSDTTSSDATSHVDSAFDSPAVAPSRAPHTRARRVRQSSAPQLAPPSAPRATPCAPALPRELPAPALDTWLPAIAPHTGTLTPAALLSRRGMLPPLTHDLSLNLTPDLSTRAIPPAAQTTPAPLFTPRTSSPPQPGQSSSESLNRRTPDFPCPRPGALMSVQLSATERDALGAIALLAAFADGSPDDAERARMHAAIQAEEGISNDIYQRVIFKRTDAAREAAALTTPESRRAAFDLAVAVCDSDGATNAAEKAFLTSLASTLGIAPDEARKTIEQVDLLAEAPVSAPVPAQAMVAAPTIVGAAAAPAAPAAADPLRTAVDGTITNHAILCGALELLPQTLATAAIIPVQMKMVYSIGKQYGFNLDTGHIKDFLATIGVGMTSQVVEGAARRIMGNLLESVAGKLVGKGLAGTIGSYGQKATGGAITFASTYALGQVARQYYAGGRKLSAIDLKTLFTNQTESAKQMYEKYRPAVEQQAQKLNPAQLLSLVRG